MTIWNSEIHIHIHVGKKEYFPLSLGNSIMSEKSYSLHCDSVHTTRLGEFGPFSIWDWESVKELTIVSTLTDILSGLEFTPGFGLPQSEPISESEIGALVEELWPSLGNPNIVFR